MIYKQTTNDITISVRVEYIVPDDEETTPQVWAWAYFITMENKGRDTVQLKTRHWTITDALGRVQTVDGVGVVGENPLLEPDDVYRYQSGCPLQTPSGSMTGYYMFENTDGEMMKIPVPAFSLDVPGQRRVLN
ncbi:Co2+/Mg2+ efflux protein ApaG [Asticcacaulis tiandongensis]|uniref:Co2+/Mg2+ efflux protein ApaG n=1 Tax=Asticcacaulis tiandongensis TaxID=2565365 RepID=UPI0011283419|nr:Co2+/Mg2+ efflux protein ApaG [Asticcacaulis tiandongensis]